ncbi:MAG TPA: adenosine kinase [Alphaproteobacteria bacterium]
MSYKVTAIGNTILDILAYVDEDFIQQENLVKGQAKLINAQESEFLYNKLKVETQQSGGSAANSIAGFASLGGKSAFIGVIANDMFGEQFTSDIQDIGVTFKSEVIDGRGPTGTCLAMITPDGERTMSTHLGVSVHMTPDAIDMMTIRDSEIIFLEGYMFLQDMGLETLQAAALMAHTADRQIALTLSDPFCVQMKRDIIADFITGHVNILLCNEAEVKLLFETDDLNHALAQLPEHVELAVVTCGEKGCIIVQPGQIDRVPAAKVIQVVDSTGAGDLFAAGFLYGITHGMDKVSAAKLGNQCAALIIQQIGARPQKSLQQLLLSAA